jgi:hypothetical protein
VYCSKHTQSQSQLQAHFTCTLLCLNEQIELFHYKDINIAESIAFLYFWIAFSGKCFKEIHILTNI